jgi:hypothetical protein
MVRGRGDRLKSHRLGLAKDGGPADNQRYPGQGNIG